MCLLFFGPIPGQTFTGSCACGCSWPIGRPDAVASGVYSMTSHGRQCTVPCHPLCASATKLSPTAPALSLFGIIAFTQVANMPFKRTVEIGRVALCTYGPDAGKLYVIVDVLDSNRVVVDRPDMVRSSCLLKRLAVTDLKADIPRLPKKGELTKAYKGVEDAFNATNWGKKLQKRQSKANMTDFERFQAMIAKTKRARAVRKAEQQLQKSA
eukprot:jgi/Ulvmu1/7515/UM037_0059.1